jgi:hypothetical protein
VGFLPLVLAVVGFHLPRRVVVVSIQLLLVPPSCWSSVVAIVGVSVVGFREVGGVDLYIV